MYDTYQNIGQVKEEESQGCCSLCLHTGMILWTEDATGVGAASRRTSATHRTSVTPTAAEGRNAVSRMSVRPDTRMTMYEQSVMGGVYT